MPFVGDGWPYVSDGCHGDVVSIVVGRREREARGEIELECRTKDEK